MLCPIVFVSADDPVAAWRVFVQPGEAVGIKVVPNGYPGAHTSPELILEVIEGLRSAGIKLKDMVVFDRYGLEFHKAQYQDVLPAGVAFGGLTPVAWDPGQLAINFDTKDPIAGYDPVISGSELRRAAASSNPAAARSNAAERRLRKTRRCKNASRSSGTLSASAGKKRSRRRSAT